MTDEAIEAAAMAMCDSALGGKGCPCLEKGVFKCSDAHPADMARAAAPALMEEGARLALEAMRPLAHAAASAIYGLPEMLERNALTDEEGMISEIKMALAGFRALDPAAIVKGAGHDRD